MLSMNSDFKVYHNAQGLFRANTTGTGIVSIGHVAASGVWDKGKYISPAEWTIAQPFLKKDSEDPPGTFERLLETPEYDAPDGIYIARRKKGNQLQHFASEPIVSREPPFPQNLYSGQPDEPSIVTHSLGQRLGPKQETGPGKEMIF